MNLRTTGLLLAVAAALAAFVYFYEIRGEPDRKAAKAAASRLFPGFEADDVDSIELLFPDGAAVRARRSGDAWRLVHPVDFPATKGAFDAMAHALAAMKSVATIDDPAEPTVYALGTRARGAAEVRFRVGDESRSLVFGRETPVGANVYVKTDESDAIHLVGRTFASSFDRELSDLRDRNVLRFDRRAVSRIVLRWADLGKAERVEVALERADPGWRIVEPAELDADASAVAELLATLAFLRAERFAEPPPGPSVTGLATPRYEAVLSREGEPDQRLAVGDAVENEAGEGPELSWVHGGESALYLVRSAGIEALPRSLFALRYKQLTRFAAARVGALELVYRSPGGDDEDLHRVRLERDANGEWTSAAGPLDNEAVRALVTQLADLRASGLAADELGEAERRTLGLEPARLAVRVHAAHRDGEETPAGAPLAEVFFGAANARGDVLARTGTRSEIYTVSPRLVESIPMSLDAFRDTLVVDAAAESDG